MLIIVPNAGIVCRRLAPSHTHGGGGGIRIVISVIAFNSCIRDLARAAGRPRAGFITHTELRKLCSS